MSKNRIKKFLGSNKLYQQICFILMKAGVSGPEINECIHWAFGPNAWYIPIRADNLIDEDWVQRWNKLHPEICIVKPKDNFVEFVFVVGTFFMAQKRYAAFKQKGGTDEDWKKIVEDEQRGNSDVQE